MTKRNQYIATQIFSITVFIYCLVLLFLRISSGENLEPNIKLRGLWSSDIALLAMPLLFFGGVIFIPIFSKLSSKWQMHKLIKNVKKRP